MKLGSRSQRRRLADRQRAEQEAFDRDTARLSSWRDSEAPACPRCLKKMRVVEGRYGVFFGCPSFPTCRGKRTIRKEHLPPAPSRPPEKHRRVGARLTVLELRTSCSLCGREIPRGLAYAAGRNYRHVRCHQVTEKASRLGLIARERTSRTA